MTTIPTITALPTPVPQTSDPVNFDTRADAFLAALPTLVTEENAAIAAMNTVAGEVSATAAAAAGSAATAAGSAATAATQAANAAASATLGLGASGYITESATSFSIGTGSKAFTVAAGKAFAAADAVVAVRKGDPGARMYGTVSSYASTTLTLNVTSVLGSGGPFTDWMILEQALEVLPAATAAQVRAGVSGGVAVTPAGLVSAAAFITLTDAATVAWDTSQGFNATVTLGGNRTIGAPTNLQDGLTYCLELVQDATGSRVPTWNSVWDFGASGTPPLQTAASKRDRVYAIYRAASGKLHASFNRGA